MRNGAERVFNQPFTKVLSRKPEVHDVTVFHDVFFAFNA
jgi:hypothetical protein